jgi:hypothetical protein
VKTFYSLEDIESLVAQGVRELIVDEDVVLTDVAHDAAARMGLKLLPMGRGPAAAVAPLPVGLLPAAPGAGEVPAQLRGARPRGCQHGPLGGHGQVGTAPSSKVARPGGPSGGLVDDLVGAVRQMAGKGSTVGGGARDDHR